MKITRKVKFYVAIFMTAILAFLAPIPYVFAQSEPGTITLEALQEKFVAGESCKTYDKTIVTEAGVLSGVTASCYSCGTCDACDILTVLITLADFILKTFAILAAIFFVYGAGWLMMSSGNDEYVKRGKDAIRASIIGSIIVLMAFQITSLVMMLLVNRTVFEGQDGGVSGTDIIRGWYAVADTCKRRPISTGSTPSPQSGGNQNQAPIN